MFYRFAKVWKKLLKTLWELLFVEMHTLVERRDLCKKAATRMCRINTKLLRPETFVLVARLMKESGYCRSFRIKFFHSGLICD